MANKIIHKLPPAHCLIIENSQLKLKRYWDPSNVEAIRYKERNDYYEHFHSVFERAVKVRLRSDYPIATQLSGGFDSSAVTAIAAQLLQQQNQSLLAMGLVPPHNKLLVEKGWSVDDSMYMEQMAALYPNIELVKMTGEGERAFSDLQTHQKYLDVPVRNIYNRLWLEAMNRMAQQNHRRVLLTGQMGNLTISWTGGPRKTIKSCLRPARNYMRQFLMNVKQRWSDSYPWEFYSPISKSFAKKHGLFEQYVKKPPFSIIRNVADFPNTLSDIGNAYIPYEAMFGIECRDPTADKQIIEFCQAIPTHIFATKGKSRLLIREGMAKQLPYDLRWRKTRGTQVADWYLKFDAELPLLKDMLQQLNNSEFSHFFDLPHLNQLLFNWCLPHYKENTFLDSKLMTHYQAKFLRSMTAYTFLEQMKALQQQRLETVKKIYG